MRPRPRPRSWRAAALVALVLGACDSRPQRTPHEVPPPLAASVLAVPDTARGWVGERTAADSAALALTVIWNATDPACIAALPVIEAWHEAYARFGLRVTGVHFAEVPSLADSAVVATAARRAGLRFATALAGGPPPSALAAGRGVVVAWGDTPQVEWVASGADARRVEARLRGTLRARHPRAPFPADDGVAAPAPGGPRWRRLSIAPASLERGPLRGVQLDQAQPFTTEFRFQQEGALEVPVPVGWWTPRADGIEAARGGAANFLAIRYDAARVGLVIAPPATGAARVWVLQDERWIPAGEAGGDVRFDANGGAFLEVDATRYYEVTRGGRHVLKLSPEVAGVRFHAFHFETAQPRP